MTDPEISELRQEVENLKADISSLVEAEADYASASIASPITFPVITGGSSTPGPFEPVFDDEDGSLISVGEGMVPFGRSFYFVESLEADGLDGCLVCLKIEHKQSSSSPYYVTHSPSITSVSCNFDVGGELLTIDDIEPSDTDSTTLPLYVINGGSVVLDLRCYLSLAIRE